MHILLCASCYTDRSPIPGKITVRLDGDPHLGANIVNCTSCKTGYDGQEECLPQTYVLSGDSFSQRVAVNFESSGGAIAVENMSYIVLSVTSTYYTKITHPQLWFNFNVSRDPTCTQSFHCVVKMHECTSATISKCDTSSRTAASRRSNMLTSAAPSVSGSGQQGCVSLQDITTTPSQNPHLRSVVTSKTFTSVTSGQVSNAYNEAAKTLATTLETLCGADCSGDWLFAPHWDVKIVNVTDDTHNTPEKALNATCKGVTFLYGYESTTPGDKQFAFDSCPPRTTIPSGYDASPFHDAASGGTLIGFRRDLDVCEFGARTAQQAYNAISYSRTFFCDTIYGVIKQKPIPSEYDQSYSYEPVHHFVACADDDIESCHPSARDPCVGISRAACGVSGGVPTCKVIQGGECVDDFCASWTSQTSCIGNASGRCTWGVPPTGLPRADAPAAPPAPPSQPTDTLVQRFATSDFSKMACDRIITPLLSEDYANVNTSSLHPNPSSMRRDATHRRPSINQFANDPIDALAENSNDQHRWIYHGSLVLASGSNSDEADGGAAPASVEYLPFPQVAGTASQAPFFDLGFYDTPLSQCSGDAVNATFQKQALLERYRNATRRLPALSGLYRTLSVDDAANLTAICKEDMGSCVDASSLKKSWQRAVACLLLCDHLLTSCKAEPSVAVASGARAAAAGGGSYPRVCCERTKLEGSQQTWNYMADLFTYECPTLLLRMCSDPRFNMCWLKVQSLERQDGDAEYAFAGADVAGVKTAPSTHESGPSPPPWLGYGNQCRGGWPQVGMYINKTTGQWEHLKGCAEPVPYRMKVLDAVCKDVGNAMPEYDTCPFWKFPDLSAVHTHALQRRWLARASSVQDFAKTTACSIPCSLFSGGSLRRDHYSLDDYGASVSRAPLFEGDSARPTDPVANVATPTGAVEAPPTDAIQAPPTPSSSSPPTTSLPPSPSPLLPPMMPSRGASAMCDDPLLRPSRIRSRDDIATAGDTDWKRFVNLCSCGEEYSDCYAKFEWPGREYNPDEQDARNYIRASVVQCPHGGRPTKHQVRQNPQIPTAPLKSGDHTGTRKKYNINYFCPNLDEWTPMPPAEVSEAYCGILTENDNNDNNDNAGRLDIRWYESPFPRKWASGIGADLPALGLCVAMNKLSNHPPVSSGMDRAAYTLFRDWYRTAATNTNYDYCTYYEGGNSGTGSEKERCRQCNANSKQFTQLYTGIHNCYTFEEKCSFQTGMPVRSGMLALLQNLEGGGNSICDFFERTLFHETLSFNFTMLKAQWGADANSSSGRMYERIATLQKSPALTDMLPSNGGDDAKRFFWEYLRMSDVDQFLNFGWCYPVALETDGVAYIPSAFDPSTGRLYEPNAQVVSTRAWPGRSVLMDGTMIDNSFASVYKYEYTGVGAGCYGGTYPDCERSCRANSTADRATAQMQTSGASSRSVNEHVATRVKDCLLRCITACGVAALTAPKRYDFNKAPGYKSWKAPEAYLYFTNLSAANVGNVYTGRNTFAMGVTFNCGYKDRVNQDEQHTMNATAVLVLRQEGDADKLCDSLRHGDGEGANVSIDVYSFLEPTSPAAGWCTHQEHASAKLTRKFAFRHVVKSSAAFRAVLSASVYVSQIVRYDAGAASLTWSQGRPTPHGAQVRVVVPLGECDSPEECTTGCFLNANAQDVSILKSVNVKSVEGLTGSAYWMSGLYGLEMRRHSFPDGSLNQGCLQDNRGRQMNCGMNGIGRLCPTSLECGQSPLDTLPGEQNGSEGGWKYPFARRPSCFPNPPYSSDCAITCDTIRRNLWDPIRTPPSPPDPPPAPSPPPLPPDMPSVNASGVQPYQDDAIDANCFPKPVSWSGRPIIPNGRMCRPFPFKDGTSYLNHTQANAFALNRSRQMSTWPQKDEQLAWQKPFASGHLMMGSAMSAFYARQFLRRLQSDVNTSFVNALQNVYFAVGTVNEDGRDATGTCRLVQVDNHTLILVMSVNTGTDVDVGQMDLFVCHGGSGKFPFGCQDYYGGKASVDGAELEWATTYQPDPASWKQHNITFNTLAPPRNHDECLFARRNVMREACWNTAWMLRRLTDLKRPFRASARVDCPAEMRVWAMKQTTVPGDTNWPAALDSLESGGGATRDFELTGMQDCQAPSAYSDAVRFLSKGADSFGPTLDAFASVDGTRVEACPNNGDYPQQVGRNSRSVCPMSPSTSGGVLQFTSCDYVREHPAQFPFH